MRECKAMKSLYYVANDKEEIVFLMSAHVDNVISVCVPEYEHILDKFLSNIEVRKTEEGLWARIFSRYRFFCICYLQRQYRKILCRLISPEQDDP